MADTGNWRRQPQGTWLRKALFQVHLWTGLGVGLYVVVISLTGSVLVYRSELRQRFDPQPRPVSVAGSRLSPDAFARLRDQQGQVAGSFMAKNFPGARIAVLHDKTAYGKGLADETKKELNARGV